LESASVRVWGWAKVWIKISSVLSLGLSDMSRCLIGLRKMRHTAVASLHDWSLAVHLARRLADGHEPTGCLCRPRRLSRPPPGGTRVLAARTLARTPPQRRALGEASASGPRCVSSDISRRLRRCRLSTLQSEVTALGVEVLWITLYIVLMDSALTATYPRCLGRHNHGRGKCNAEHPASS
jgi:hypothetical protein